MTTNRQQNGLKWVQLALHRGRKVRTFCAFVEESDAANRDVFA
jgi:hypothetical protein